MFFDKVGQDLDDDIIRQSMEMKLHGMLRPVTPPVIVQINLHRLILIVHALGEEVLNSGVLGEGDMRAQVKQEPAVVAK